ncbi:hypothetical protein EON80_06635 [bacterium]|nr:MAG: hypothetical protein EON80_06635 [bacterium]
MPSDSTAVMVTAIFLLLVGFLCAKYLGALKSIILFYRYLRHEKALGSPQDLPGFNAGDLQALTRQMEELGFVFLEDELTRTYSSKAEPLPEEPAVTAPPIAAPTASAATPTNPQKRPTAFERMMTQPEHGCLGKLSFTPLTTARGKVVAKASMGIILTSIAEGSDWIYFTTDLVYPPSVAALLSLQRHPHRLTTRVRHASPQELLQMHLSRRAAIAKAAGIQWKRTLNMDDDRHIDDVTIAEARRLYQRMTVWQMLKGMVGYWREKKSDEWLGELAGRI